MSLFKYKAVRRKTGATTGGASAVSSVLAGELAGENGADVRAQLRRAGLQVIDLEIVRERSPAASPRADAALPPRGARAGELGRTSDVVSPVSYVGTLRAIRDSYLRGRRRAIRSELFDGLATMLESGMPMLESVDAMLRTRAGAAAHRLLLSVREALKDGSSLAAAFRAEVEWFDPVEVAMTEAGQHGGTLPSVLRVLADRHARSGQLLMKLSSALAYPTIVLSVGLGVVAFLATKTLPELVSILTDAKIEPPALTLHVITVGRALASAWWAVPSAALVLALVVVMAKRHAAARSASSANSGDPGDPGDSGDAIGKLARLRERLRPDVLRRLRIGGASFGLAELVKTGVPLVDALRVLAPTTGSASLRDMLRAAADRLERGQTLADAFSGSAWFDEEFLRLLEIGQATGELPSLLERIGARYERSAARAIDRLAGLLEPAAILTLAALVGCVALAAVLPLFKLQEIL